MIRKRSVVLANTKTSVSLEDEFWSALLEMAAERKIAVSTLVLEIKVKRQQPNLSSALRLAALAHYKDMASSEK